MSRGITKDAELESPIDNELGVYDFTLDSEGDINTKNFFDTSILMSLFAERRATSAEIPTSHLRRGWIGNESSDDFEIGSKLWLYEQARLNLDSINGIKSAIKEGLKWMVDDGIAISITVGVVVSDNTTIVEVIITKPNSKVEHMYFDLWENTGI